jgi:uncharacterized protein YjbJ (UPF0337 family)
MKRTATYLSIFVAVALLAGVASATAAAASPSDYLIIKVINQDQFEGNWKQFKGDLKKKWGKFTDDDLLVIEGNYDKFEGKLQERYGDQKEKVKKWTDEWFETHGKKSGKKS